MDELAQQALEIFTFADLLTAPGSVAAAAFLTTAGLIIVALLPSSWTWLIANRIAVALSAILYTVAYFVLELSVNGILALLVSWTSCAAAILGIKYSLVELRDRMAR